MIQELREKFNKNFTKDKYQHLLIDLDTYFSQKVEFKVAETPIFIPETLKNKLIQAADEIMGQLLREDYLSQTQRAIPAEFKVANDYESSPDFLAIDFAICKNEKGEFLPQLIELQGFPSLYGFQHFLNLRYRRYYDISKNLTHLFLPELHQNEIAYRDLLKKILLGNSAPENVILMEIEPEKQKTAIDFNCTELFTGVKAVCVSKIRKEGRKLYYEKNGEKIGIERIYNRVIFDELVQRRDLQIHFDFREELDVEWVGHPNWFFKLSKFSLPFLNSKFVPKTYFLNELSEYPKDLENYVLKPLFSFAGAGVELDLNVERLRQITDKENYILMKKVEYAPVIQTLDIPAKAEIRLLFAKIDGKLQLLTNLVRLSKGKMIGVNFNKGKDWVGGTIGYFSRN